MKYNRKKIVVRWWHIVLVIVFFVLAVDQHLTNRLNERFNGRLEYDPVKKYKSETYNNCDVIASKACFLSGQPVRAVVSMTDVYYNEQHKTVAVDLTIYTTKYGEQLCMLGFEDWNEELQRYDYSFGGYAYVDSNMRILDIEENDGINKKVMEGYIEELNSTIECLVDTANYYWELGLTVE